MILVLGDCLEKLKELDENSVDAIVTDPPYGLSFMGKKWDYDVPSIELWREVLRVLKPGGHLLSFGGTRTYHRMVVNIEDAGFEIRDQIQWLYGSGFPKSHNLKNEWKGWGTALKPANEPIVLARKPIEKGLTIAENVLKYGVGGLNIDASRVATDEQAYFKTDSTVIKSSDIIKVPNQIMRGGGHTQGRWPANIILDEVAAEMLGESSRFFYVAKASKSERNRGLEGMPEKSQGACGEFAGDGRGRQTEHQPTANFHPTVKPVKLMEYLIKLVTPPQGKVLDPFMGSGTTGVAAKLLGFDFVGIEREKEYLEIAEKRIKSQGGDE